MANPKQAKNESPAPANKKTAAKKTHLVTVQKDGERIDISPLTLDNHVALGWKPLDEGQALAQAAPVGEDETSAPEDETD